MTIATLTAQRLCNMIGCLLISVVVIALSPSARAGEADFQQEDIDQYGTPYFGEAKDIKGMAPLEGVRFKAQVRGTMRFFLITTDDEGRFRRNGLGNDVDSETVEVTCEKSGYRTVDLQRRRTSAKRNAPVEVECLMEKQ
jgi:hypothetical protein